MVVPASELTAGEGTLGASHLSVNQKQSPDVRLKRTHLVLLRPMAV